MMAMAAGLLAFAGSAAADTFEDEGFSTETIASVSPYTLVGMQFAPDGRLFVWQKNGVIRIIDDGELLPTPFLDISDHVNTADDRGFWGMAFDPNFATNGYVYLSYTYEHAGDPNSLASRTSRLTRIQASGANPNVAIPGSETTILGTIGTPPCTGLPANADCIGADSGSHTIGALHFANDGSLFVGVGDGADAAFVDPNSMRSQDLDRPEGKILRIRTDGSALPDNPFYDGTNSWRSRVWVYGLRNPFGFTLHPATQEIFFGDVGWNTWEEINYGAQGTNFGWPCFEGNLPQAAYRAQFSQCANMQASSVTMPFYTYDHGSGSAAIGGPIYQGSLYPEQYRDSFYFSDYSGNFIRRLVLDENHRPVSQKLFASNVPAPVAIAEGPEGMLYYLSFTTGEIRRIRFNGVSASASATPRHGHSPLTVQFSSAGTTNQSGGSLSYAWDFGDGATSTAQNPSHTYTTSTARSYTARLTVTSSNGQTSTTTVSVTVGSTPPTPVINAPATGLSVKPGQAVPYSGSATDPEDGNLPPSALEWRVLLHHNTHIHTFVGGTGASGSFVAENHGSIGTFRYEIILTARDSSGLASSTSIDVAVASDEVSPTAPGSLTATPVGHNRVNLNWAASTDDVDIENYRIERCLGAGCTNFAQIETSADPQFADTAVAGATTYRYRVRAVDPSNNFSAYSGIAEATTAMAPVTPGLVGAWGFGEGFGSTTADASGNGNFGTVMNTTWTDQGRFGNALMFNGTNSLVRVNGSTSLNLPDALTLSAWIRPASAQGGWRTIVQREPHSYFLNASNETGALRPAGGGMFGGSTQWLSAPAPNPLNQWSHVAMTYDGASMRMFVNGLEVSSRPLTGAVQTSLNPLWMGGNMPYGEYFQGLIDEVRIYDRALTAAEISNDMTTAVQPVVPDTTPPSTPTGVTATPASSSQVNVVWSPSTDNMGVNRYRVERCTGAGCTNFAEVAAPTSPSFNDTGRQELTTYRYRVRAVDVGNNLSGYSAIATATTPVAPDTTPPTAPSTLAGTLNGTTAVDLTWTAATDNLAVTEYRIERCQGVSCAGFTQIGTSATAAFTATGMTEGLSYRYRVRAADAAGNVSTYSNVFSIVAPGAPDATPPSAPTGLNTTDVAHDHVNLGWTASTDNVEVAGYRVERCVGAGCTSFAEIAAPPGPAFSDTGVVLNTTYRYRVRAIDTSGNLGAYSTAVQATTPAVAPPVGLIGAWGFNEGAGLLTADASGNGNTASLLGASWSTFGRFGGAISFNGSSTVRVPGSASLNVGGTMTLSAWVNPTVFQGGWRTIMQREPHGYFLNASNQTGSLFPAGGGVFGGSTAWTSGTTANAVGAWTHVALTYDGAAIRVFQNGTQVGQTAAAGAVESSTNPLSIGGNTPYGEYFTGLIDEVRVYSRALSPSEIGLDMNSPVVPVAPDTVAPSAPASATATAASAARVDVSWPAATDNVGILRYRVERCSGAGCTNFTEVATPETTSLADTDLAASTVYRYRVRAVDLAGNVGDYSPIAGATTQALPDTTAPTAPSALTATPAGNSQADLTWGASTDNVGVTEYRIERCKGSSCTSFAQVGTSATTAFSSTGLVQSSTYRFRVRAVDAAGNLGAYSSIASATTPGVPDTTPPSPPVGLDTTAVESNRVALGWTASTDDVDVAGYRVERCVGGTCTSFAEIGNPEGTSYEDAGVSVSTAYRYRVRAVDGAGNVGAYSNVIDAVTPGPVGLVGAWGFNEGAGTSTTDNSGNGNTGALVGAAWSAFGRYGSAVSFNGSSTVRVPGSTSLNVGGTMTLSAWVNPSALQSGWRTIIQREPHGYFLNASNQTGGLFPAGGGVFGGGIVWASGTSANPVGSWTHVALTYDGSFIRVFQNGVQVGQAAAAGPVESSANPLSIGGNTPYGEYFTGLIDEVRVYKRALSATEITADMNTPVQPPVPDTTPPSTPGGVTAVAASSARVDVSWTAATDDVAVSGYRVERCSGAGCTNFLEVGTPTAATLADTGVDASTAYRYRVRAVDAAGNLSGYSAIATATTPAPPDTSAPSAPGTLTASAAGTSQIDLTWGAATDDAGVTEYRIERCKGAACTGFAQVGTSATLAFSSAGLTQNSAYRFRVRAVDAAGNLGAYSNIASATTQGVPDTTPPSAPSGLIATAIEFDRVALSWTAATDNVDVAEYRVERCVGGGCTGFAEIGAPEVTSFANESLAAGTTYRYRVRAVDGAGNLGAYSSVLEVATANAPPPVGLVGAWGFNEGAGTSTADASGNGNTGTLMGAGWSAFGRFGGAISFNGSSTVRVPASASLNVGGTMTLSAWVNPTVAQGGWRTIIQREPHSYFLNASNQTGALNPSGGGVFGGGTTWVSGSTPNAVNTWTHVALTYDGAALRVFQNGVQVAQTAATGPVESSGSPLSIGGNTPYGEYFTGLIDEVRVYKRALSAAEIGDDMNAAVAAAAPDTTAPAAPASLTATAVSSGRVDVSWPVATDNVGVAGYRVERCSGAGCTSFAEVGTPESNALADAGLDASTLYRYRVRTADFAGNLSPYSTIAEATTPAPSAVPPGLVGAWGFGEGEGTTTADASGNGNGGTLMGATWTDQGRYGNALAFNGTSSRVRVEGSSSLNVSSAMTLSAWIRPAAAQTGWRTILQREPHSWFLNSSNETGDLRPAGGGVFGGSTQWLSAPSANPVAAWSHIALTYNGTTMRMFVNGTEVSSRALTGAIETTLNPLWMGGNSPYGEYYDGLIDEVRVYNRALTGAEITTDMNTPIDWSGLPNPLL